MWVNNVEQLQKLGKKKEPWYGEREEALEVEIVGHKYYDSENGGQKRRL